MQDHYYSKKLQRSFPTRLDFLLYAHDGRGFGHVSRTVAVGLAIRRRYPDYRVLLVTGLDRTAMLIGAGDLDWIKLPAYKTVLQDGVPEGQDSAAGFYKSVLGQHRGAMLEAIISILRPRCALVDHNPFGKRDELVKALESHAGAETRWVLGLRGVIGDDKNLWSGRSRDLVGNCYREILWYGNSEILGTEPLQRLKDHFPVTVSEVGYVSRVSELSYPRRRGPLDKNTACTISLPWLGESGGVLIEALKEALGSIGEKYGIFRIFVPDDHLDEIKKRLVSTDFCTVEPISGAYIGSLLQSSSALVYGGYNSLLDAAAGGLPTLVILRSTEDNEQRQHLDRLRHAVGQSWRVLSEDEISRENVEAHLRYLLSAKDLPPPRLDIKGAERSADRLHQIIGSGG